MTRQERTWIIAWATVQGLGLWLLHEWLLGLDKKVPMWHLIWPSYVFITTFPLSLMVLSTYRQDKRLWGMAAGFSLIMSGAAAYVGYQAWAPDVHLGYTSQLGFTLMLITLVNWFVLLPFAEHQLLKGRWCSDYAFLFSAAWRNWVKLALAALFTGLFWALLFLLAGLFKVLNIDFFMILFTSRIFAYPVTAIAFGIGLSLYAAKEEALVGIYRASLNILGWLLPVVSFILILFLLALPFQGLALLWKTGYATSLMLCLLAWAVFLFNAAWQDASGEQRFPKWLLRFIGVGLLTMPVYIVLCAYSLALRVTQYGWTIDRIWAALMIVVMAIYALGYAWVVLKRQTIWMQGAKRINIAAALFTVLLLILTITPVLDPARIAVHSQVSRLLAQKTQLQDFDFAYLRFDSGRIGHEALLQLSKNTTHPQAEALRQQASLTLKKTSRYEVKPEVVAEDTLRQKLQMYPQGIELAEDFVEYLRVQLNADKLYISCTAEKPCPLLQLDLNQDRQAELVLLNGYSSMVFSLQQGRWRRVGTLTGDLSKLSQKGTIQALEQGQVKAQLPTWHDLEIGGQRYGVDGVNDHLEQ